MPAKKKYLHQSGWDKAGKVTAAFFGGLFATMGLHMAAALWLDMQTVFSTTLYSFFIIWPLMMVGVYWIRKPWISWAVMMGICLFSGVFIYLGKM
ncbi:MAG: hypothetical protein AAGC85_06075 [Bacteroidota bacterium]